MANNKKHLILIGMPACGKSTAGVLVAKELGFRFIDSDLVIQEREGRRLHEIIESEKNDGFLRIEERVNLSLGCDGIPAVIATGGSAVYSETAMLHFRSIGTVVFLHLPYEVIKKRLGNFTHRGVIMPEGYTLRNLYDERCKLCRHYADITIYENQDTDISGVVHSICNAFGSHNKCRSQP